MSGRRRSKGNTNNPNHYRGRPVGDYYKNVYKRTGGKPMDPDNREGTEEPGVSKLRHHPHLKGREIGLWYSRLKKTETRRKPVGSILLSERKKQQIQAILNANTFDMNDFSNKYEHVKDSKFKRDFLKIINGDLYKSLEDPKLTLIPDKTVDEQLYDEFLKKNESPGYKSMLKQRMKLPSFNGRKELLELIEANQVIVISGETGCGKTTQVAQFILDDYIEKKKGSICRIICTQPRRISAISVAERVASERTEKLGESVGYQIRLEKKLPRDKGSIKFCTTGVILKLMESDPCLRDVSHLILDEIHERDILADFLLTIMRDVITKRKDLKLILMSATLNSEAFSKYYNNCPHINIPGFTYPVKEYFLEDVIEITKFKFPVEEYKLNRAKMHRMRDQIRQYIEFIEPYVQKLEKEGKYSRHTCFQLRNCESEKLNVDLIFEIILHISRHEKEEGAILVFLPGFSDISSLNQVLERSGLFPYSKFLIFPLHSQMPTVDQRQIFLPAPSGKRKIILSTNIAETSVTIDDVVYVIDCGKIKMTNFDVETNQQTLAAEWVSKANANQRKGRAGRVKPGVCYHLYSKAREAKLDEFQTPEVLRKRLEEVILVAKMLQLGKIYDFFSKLMNSPHQDAIKISLDLLKSLNALDEEENLTPLGYHLAKLPIGPQMGKMIVLGAVFSCLNPILSVAASLGFKDAFQLPLGKEKEADRKKMELSNGWKSDHLVLFQALEIFETTYNQRQFCWEYFLSVSTLKLLQKMKGQFMEHLHEMQFVQTLDPKAPECNKNSKNFSLVKAVICAGLYPNVGLYIKKKRRNFLRGLDGTKLEFHPKSILSKMQDLESPLFVYFLKMKSTADFVHDATMVYPLPIVFFGDKYDIFKNETGQNLIKIHSSLTFKCSENTSLIIKDLREKLNWFLAHKISHPGYVNWDEDSYEIHMLRAIMELITSEDMGDFDSDCFEDID